MIPTRAALPATGETGSLLAQFVSDVRYYLVQRPRQLPSRYFYDDLGSALFEAICRLPWYRITRAEGRLLERVGADVFRRAGPVSTIVELGSGSGEKLRTLVSARPRAARDLDVHIVDLSSRALDLSATTLAPLENVRLTAHERSYEAGLREATKGPHQAGVLVLFLGSNIGNFDPPGAHAFLHGIRSDLRPGDGLLLGADLVKPPRELQLAYDDPLGVTAAFNLNLLARINRELGGDFDLRQFAHRATWNAAESRVEMHIVARRAQTITIQAAGLGLRMKRGEHIWTESSYKYRPDRITQMIQGAGFHVSAQWVDDEDGFALTLAEAV